jgi:hypothetical protein
MNRLPSAWVVSGPRKKGQRLPTLAQVATDPATRWTRLTLERWYSQGQRIVEITTDNAV